MSGKPLRLWTCPVCWTKCRSSTEPKGWLTLDEPARVVACPDCLRDNPKLRLYQKPRPAFVDTPAGYLARNRDWLDQARCARIGLEWLEQPYEAQLADCSQCPVGRACLAHAIETGAVGVVQAGVRLERPLAPSSWEGIGLWA